MVGQKRRLAFGVKWMCIERPWWDAEGTRRLKLEELAPDGRL